MKSFSAFNTKIIKQLKFLKFKFNFGSIFLLSSIVALFEFKIKAKMELKISLLLIKQIVQFKFEFHFFDFHLTQLKALELKKTFLHAHSTLWY